MTPLASQDPRTWKRLYRLISWIGIAINVVIVAGLLFFTRRFFALFGASSEPITWAQLCGELLTLITVFYVPPALEVDRFRPYAWIAALATRGSTALLLGVGVLAFGAPRYFLLGAGLDLAIGATQAYLLSRLGTAERGFAGPCPSAPAPVAPRPPGFNGAAAACWRTTYRWVATVGIGANLLFVLPLVFAPHEMLHFLNVGSTPVLWAQLAGLLLGLISVFYVPAIMDPDRYRLYTWLAIFPSRAFGVLFTFLAVIFLGANESFLLGVTLDLPFLVLQTFILVRLERAEQTPPGRTTTRRAWRFDWREAAAVLSVFVIIGTVGWHKLFRVWPQQLVDRTIEERFKHGSIGAEDAAGLPYWIWITLPNVFPEYLPKPGGYAALGLLWEPGTELPIGFSRKKIGFDRVAINCALCHTGSVQVPGQARPLYVLGAPATTANILGYQRFLFQSARDARFNAETLLPAIARNVRLSWLDGLLYRYVLIPQTRSALRQQAAKWVWTEEKGRPEWGPGRIEPFNPVKLSILESVDAKVQVGSTLGTSDMQALWRLGEHPGRAFHWDGLNTDLREVVDSSALGDGATKKSIPRRQALRELQDWISERNVPPSFAETFRTERGNPINPELARRGEVVFTAECARCHGPNGPGLGQLTPVAGPEGVGTDDNRARMWTPESATAYNGYLRGLSWKFEHFRSTGQYVNVPLDGLWLKAPYLHNGSVPTLVDLLKPPGERPVAFLRGLNEYDQQNVGFVAHAEYPAQAGRSAAEADAADPQKYGGFRYETSGRGNGNGGHLYGTALPPADKTALVEYLKQL